MSTRSSVLRPLVGVFFSQVQLASSARNSAIINLHSPDPCAQRGDHISCERIFRAQRLELNKDGMRRRRGRLLQIQKSTDTIILYFTPAWVPIEGGRH